MDRTQNTAAIESSSLVLPAFTPIIRFAPPLSTLLRLNRNELPLMLANERAQLVYKDQVELQAAALQHVDIGPSVSGNGGASPSPLNAKQAQTFSGYRTIVKHFNHVLFAISHALYGDMLRYNELVDVMRVRFLGSDRAHSDSPKTKIRLEALLNVLCEANDCTLDILVLTPNRDSCSLYTKFKSHVLYEGDNDGFQPHQAPRTLVALEFDSARKTWSPVGYNLLHTAGGAPSDVSAGTAAVAMPPGEPAAAKEGTIVNRFLNALTRGKLGSGTQPTPSVSVVDAESSSDDEGSTLGASTDGPKDFEAVVREADKIYHTNPYIEMQHGSSGGASRGDLAALQLRQSNGLPSTNLAGSGSGDAGRRPFQDVRYPNLDMMDCGCCDLLVETASLRYFPSACVRLLLTTLFALGAASLSIALLVLWWRDDDSACCAHISDPSTCWNQTSEAFLNITVDGGVAAQCFDQMCPSNGTLQRSALHAFLYGKRLGPGQCLWLAIAGSFVCFFLAVAVNHFTIRFLALFKAKPRFMYWLSCLHVFLAAALCAVCSYLLYTVIHLRDTRMPISCSWYEEDSVERGLCNDALLSGCDSIVSVTLPHDTDVMIALTIALIACSGLHFLTALIPTVPSEESRASIPHAIPDTAIFVPGLYAPDGATQEEIERLQLDIQLRAISGDGARWDQKHGTRDKAKARPLKFGSKPSTAAEEPKTSLKSRFANAMRKVRMQVATTRALRRESVEGRSMTMSTEQHNTHVAVHESGDRYMNADARELERKMSLTFKPRMADQAHLSGATLRDVQRISKRVKEHLVTDGPPPPEAWESSTRVRGAAVGAAPPSLDKYDHMAYQAETFGHVTVVRDAVLDDIVERLGGQRSRPLPRVSPPAPVQPPHDAAHVDNDSFDQTRVYYPTLSQDTSYA